ncbi:DUF262 domain-containing protein [Microvirga sp. Mcv34]|uniref:DUF262 domain-containing protein n=1 Tax=Microvirga sp. Mcv34 TaxID=2926016 RepID=UPI0021C6ABCA|nr:DUF262 domain-containing protein [Microvirga sp. Mcv34]
MIAENTNERLLDELNEEESEAAQIEEHTSTDSDIEAQFSSQPFRVVYQSNNFLIPQIRDLIMGGDAVNLRPEYQRRLRWTETQKSLLIESLLLNVPIPPVFFFENDLARYEVMDGQQRLNAIKEFLEGDFALRGLTVLSDLNGRRYSKLPPRVKRSLDRASISAIVLLQESQGKLKKAGTTRYYELRRFVFERLNTGGKRLNAQEIRNAIYGGEFNELIIRLSRNDVFTSVWGIPKYTNSDPNEYYEEPDRQKNNLYKTMGDCQIVLRFFALEQDEYIQGSMKSMLDKCMERYLDISHAEADRLGERYLSRLGLANELFDGRPFDLDGDKPSSRPSAGVYDGVMVALDRLWEHRDALRAKKAAIQEQYSNLLRAQAHTGKLTGAANTAQDIKDRINLLQKMFVGVVNA